MGERLQRTTGLLLPEQSVGDLRADREAVPHPALPAGPRLRLPGRAGGRQRRAGLPGGDPGRAGGGTDRPGPDAHRGLHLPDGRAHHVRRPHPLPAGQRAGDVAAAGPDRAGQGLPVPFRPGRRFVLRGDRPGGRRAGRAGPPGLPRPDRPRAADDLRRGVRRADATSRAAARPLRGVPRLLRGGGSLMPTYTLAKALNEGLRRAMEDDPKVLIMGEDVGKLGGVFRVTDGLQKDFGEDRVIDTPLAESGIVGTAIGLALRGYRPVVEIQFDGFVFPAYDQIVTQLAKMHARALGKIKLPIVIRIPYGGGIGAVEHHSESPEALFAHVAGLKVVSPSNASDAYWMMQQAIQSDDPVIFFEPKRRYWDKGEVSQEAIPSPLHKARVVREGADLTLAAYGPMVKLCQEVAEAAAEEGKSLEVLDLRSVSPIDFDSVQASVEK